MSVAAANRSARAAAVLAQPCGFADVERRLADSNCWKVAITESDKSPHSGIIALLLSTDVRSIIGPEIGGRLAALADGEGSFIIKRQVKASRVTHSCGFAIKMRADDRPFLERVRLEAGSIGRVYDAAASRSELRRNNPSTSWVVSRRDECLALCRIFDAYPLWSRKASDYVVWREAVQTWMLVRPGADQAPLAALHQRLADVRRFKAAA